MKLLVLAFTPPPHHGQSWMVEQMLEGFGGDLRRKRPRDRHAASPYDIECYHVNSRLVTDVNQIGKFSPGKMLLVFKYCLEALYCRFRYGIHTLYYAPAPPALPMALYRDWAFLAICQPFFKKTIFYWHAAGLGEWLENHARPWQRWISQKIYRHIAMASSPSEFNLPDALKFHPLKAVAAPYGIPDPCPDFDRQILPLRLKRQAEWRNAKAMNLPFTVQVLFMALCTRDKGLLDAVTGVYLANQRSIQAGSNIRYHLKVAGSFLNDTEREAFDCKIKELNAIDVVEYVGFLDAKGKKAALPAADIFCFPTYYSAESFPLVMIEAMAFGLPIISTHWRSLHELFEPGYSGLVGIKHPEEIATALAKILGEDWSLAFRNQFLRKYTLEKHLERMAAVLKAA